MIQTLFTDGVDLGLRRSRNTAWEIEIEIPHGSRDRVIVPHTVKITFNLDIESTDKTRSIVNNVDMIIAGITVTIF